MIPHPGPLSAIVAVLWLSLAAMPTLAAAAAPLRPPPPADARVRTIDYAPWQVTPVRGTFRTATQILFAPEETILHVALGDTTGWEVVAEGAILFLKPKTARPPTNLLATTRRPGGALRHYSFELSTRAGGEAIYVLRFRYPQDEAQAKVETLERQSQALERRVVKLKLERAVLTGPRNLAYEAQGSSDLQPSEISDNGRFTVLRFPGGQRLPAIYEVGEDGAERLIAFDVRGEFVVLHGTAKQLRLRHGRQVVCLYNLAFDPRQGGAPTGTVAGDVERLGLGGRP